MPATRMTPQVRIWTEEEVLGIVLNHPNLLPRLRARTRPTDFHGPELRAISEVFLAPAPGFTPSLDELRAALGPALVTTLTKLHAYSLDVNFDVLLDRLVAGRDE